MADLVVRPSTKLIQATYLLWAALGIAVAVGWQVYAVANIQYALALPAIGLAWTAMKHLALRYTTLKIAGNKLAFEEGILSRSARNVDTAKIQDVRVDQTFGQRMLNLGNLTLETAGETGRLTMPNIDRPREVADSILGASRSGQPPL